LRLAALAGRIAPAWLVQLLNEFQYWEWPAEVVTNLDEPDQAKEWYFTWLTVQSSW
jgi:hypothetical protein